MSERDDSNNSKADIAVRGNDLTATGNQMPYGITQCYLPGCHPVTFPPLPQPKLVLDLATPEGCKADLGGGYIPR